MDLTQTDFSTTLPTDIVSVPLGERVRPSQLDQIIGQEKVIKHIQRYIDSGFLPSLIFWGPPGTGKTSLALILARHFRSDFQSLNASQAGAKDLREICELGKKNRIENRRKTILFIDEVHRFNKSQQDILLPYVERGDITLIGATTENPSYELNKALLSRIRLLVFKRIQKSDICKILDSVMCSSNLALKQVFSAEALDSFLDWSDGDARKILIAAEELIALFKVDSTQFSAASLSDILGDMTIGHDKSSDSHFDLASALIKSLRGSDADAALYYLARLLKGGEDLTFISRRLIILASEDIGNADPRALQLAVACAQAVEIVGYPEAGIILSQAVCYLASSPKSNRTYLGLKKATEFVNQSGALPVPKHLKSSNELLNPENEEKTFAKYLYPHDFPRSWIDQEYFPAETVPQVFYQPNDIGFEKQISEFRKWLKGKA